MSATIDSNIFSNYFKKDNIKYAEISFSGQTNFNIEKNFIDNTNLTKYGLKDNDIISRKNYVEKGVELIIKNIIFSSTCAVYGEAEYFPIDEKHPLNPTTPYGASKKMAEEVIQWFAKINKIHYCILRYFNVCGATDDGTIGDSKKPSRLLVQNAVRGALGIEKF